MRSSARRRPASVPAPPPLPLALSSARRRAWSPSRTAPPPLFRVPPLLPPPRDALPLLPLLARRPTKLTGTPSTPHGHRLFPLSPLSMRPIWSQILAAAVPAVQRGRRGARYSIPGSSHALTRSKLPSAHHKFCFSANSRQVKQSARPSVQQEDYKAGVGPDNANSKELDAKVLYYMEGGLRHGRTPIGNGVVDKQAVLAAAKSKYVHPSSTAVYQSVLEENDQLKVTNGILLEENGVNRELILRFYADFDKAAPTDLMDRLADIDACRHQGTGSSQSGSHAHDVHNTSYASDNDNDGRNSDDMGCKDMYGGKGPRDMDGEDNGSGNQEMEE